MIGRDVIHWSELEMQYLEPQRIPDFIKAELELPRGGSRKSVSSESYTSNDIIRVTWIKKWNGKLVCACVFTEASAQQT